ncbi:type II toxin-antitoxin system RelE family toxin [Kaistia sp. MMO-174]|uniref:type II toxin-antitoxin system RelE family toxin n=1 Tax=Kaistia sp. MMO-174 TaxID=3081256 RepID=UPI003FA55EDD
MTEIEIRIAPAARREIRKLSRQAQKTVIEALELLASCPRPKGVEKITDRPDFLRVPAGRNHRIIYHIRSNVLLIVLVVRDRKDAYKGLDSLDAKLAAAISEIAETAPVLRLVGR